MFDTAGTPLIADFGLSSITFNPTNNASTPAFGISLRWAAPEILESTNEISRRPTKMSDVYAFSMVVVEVKYHHLSRSHQVLTASPRFSVGTYPSRSLRISRSKLQSRRVNAPLNRSTPPDWVLPRRRGSSSRIVGTESGKNGRTCSLSRTVWVGPGRFYSPLWLFVCTKTEPKVRQIGVRLFARGEFSRGECASNFRV